MYFWFCFIGYGIKSSDKIFHNKYLSLLYIGLNLQIIWHFIINIYVLCTYVPNSLLGVLRWRPGKAECDLCSQWFPVPARSHLLHSCSGLSVTSQSHHAYASPHHPAFLGYSCSFFQNSKHLYCFTLNLDREKLLCVLTIPSAQWDYCFGHVLFVFLSPLLSLPSSRSWIVWRQGACLFHVCIFQTRH